MGRAHKLRFHAIVVLPARAVLAMSAAHGGFDRHAVPGPQYGNGASNRYDFSGRLMSQHQRVGRRKAVNTAVQVPVHVAAANSHRTEFHQNFVRRGIRRQRHVSDLERAWRDELDGFQSTTLANCLPAAAVSPATTTVATTASAITASATVTTAASIVSAAPIVSAAVSTPIVSTPISVRGVTVVAVCVGITIGVIVIAGVRVRIWV